MFLAFFFLNFLIGGLAILRSQGVWWLILGLNFLGWLVSMILSSRDVKFSYGIREIINLGLELFYVLDKESIKAINITFMLYL